MAKKIPNVMLEGVRLVFRNFAGKEDMYNAAGTRQFSVVLPPDVAADMARDGWNVKYPKPRQGSDPDEDPRDPTIQVTVSNRLFEPQVTMIAGGRRTNLDFNSLDILDWADITNVDLVINPSVWSVGDKGGVKAYLQKMFVTIEEDALDRKYADIPDGKEE